MLSTRKDEALANGWDASGNVITMGRYSFDHGDHTVEAVFVNASLESPLNSPNAYRIEAHVPANTVRDVTLALNEPCVNGPSSTKAAQKCKMRNLEVGTPKFSLLRPA